MRSIAYVVQTPEIDQSNFLTMLRSNAYEIRSKELKQRPDGSSKGDWDMGLALDALAMCERLDVVAIVSGDGDFVELVNFLKARGVRVEVYSFPYSTSEELRHAATEYYQMGTEIVMGSPSLRGTNNHTPHYEPVIVNGTREEEFGHSEHHNVPQPLEHGESSSHYAGYP